MSRSSSAPVEQYEPNPMVWYASYGSNLNAGRFTCYITGGIPEGGTRDHVGCTDKTLPIKSMPVDLPQSLYFAGESKTWTGGMALISHHAGNQPTKGRAYLITQQQFEEVRAQECWENKASPIDVNRLRQTGHLTMGDGSSNYDELVYFGENGGYPIISFTSPTEQRPYTKPAKAYLHMIGSGLVEAHGISAHEAAIYLHTKPGILGNYTLEELAEIVHQPELLAMQPKYS